MTVVRSLGNGTTTERPIVKVFGCGGAGCNIVEDLRHVPSMEIIGVNEPDYLSAHHERAITLKREGLRDITITAQKLPHTLLTTEEKKISEYIQGADIVYILSGMGGELGSWAPSLIGKVAKRLNTLSIALVTLPFSVESPRRREMAREGMELLKTAVDCVVQFSNEKLLRIAPEISFRRAFYVMGQLMVTPILGLSQILTKSDKRMLKRAFHKCKSMRFGAGDGRGRERTFCSVKEAFKSPWFDDIKLDDAKLAIVFSSSTENWPEDLEEVVLETQKHVPNADIYYGGYTQDMRDRMRTILLLGD